MQLEIIRYSKKIDFIHVYFCEVSNSMQYRPPNACQEVDRGCVKSPSRAKEDVAGLSEIPHGASWMVSTPAHQGDDKE